MNRFGNCPNEDWPYPETNGARVMLRKAHEAASEFLSAYESSRKGKTGTSIDAEQDLLRAMLVFATAGLDATLKEIVRKCLPAFLDAASGNERVESELRTFLARRSEAGNAPDYKFLSQVLTSRDPRMQTIELWSAELTAGSLQSRQAALKVANALGLSAEKIFPKELNAVFENRNRIVHEMDLEPGISKNRSRFQRKVNEIKKLTQLALTAAAAFLDAVEAQLAQLHGG